MVIDAPNNVITVMRYVPIHHSESYVLMTLLARLNSLYVLLMADIILIRTLVGNQPLTKNLPVMISLSTNVLGCH
jgi:hypothetical protein